MAKISAEDESRPICRNLYTGTYMPEPIYRSLYAGTGTFMPEPDPFLTNLSSLTQRFSKNSEHRQEAGPTPNRRLDDITE